MKRRKFLSGALGAGLASTLLFPATLLAEHPHKKRFELGVITNTIRKELKQDAFGTLQHLADLGYKKIEFGRPIGASGETFKSWLIDLGLKPIAGGSSMSNLLKNLPEYIESCHTFGKQYLVCYWPFLEDKETRKPDEFKRIADRFNELGAACKKEGLRFAFHNHDKEFIPTGGQIPYDILLSESDPDLVTMEIDLYWVRKGGGDPIYFFKKYPGRFELCHVKDMANDAEKSIETVGKGIIDFKKIFSYAKKAGLKHVIVEEDKPADGLASVTHAHQHLKKIKVI